jgi:sulfonate transport system permease protein
MQSLITTRATEQCAFDAPIERRAERGIDKLKKIMPTVIGVLLIPALWFILKENDLVSDRYLPAPAAVFGALWEIEPNVFCHFAYTAFRLVVGLLAGVASGVMLGVAISKWQTVGRILNPILSSMRSVPAIATVPFFLLWFGFAESGKILLVVTGIAFNIAVATHQVLSEIPEKDKIMFRSFGIDPSAMFWDYTRPRLLEALLPTVRFSLSTAIGVVIVSELLGAQMGLGYLMQTARSTFSTHVILLAAILLGVLNSAIDFALTKVWTRAVYWKKR